MSGRRQACVEKKQRHTAHRIFTRLCEENGCWGCESAVRVVVAELRKRITTSFVPIAYEPAEAIQIYWGETTVFLKGIKTKINIWCTVFYAFCWKSEKYTVKTRRAFLLGE